MQSVSGRGGTSSGSVQIRVLLFARYAELVGQTELDLAVSAPATVRTVLDSLRKLAGGAKLPPSPLVARNQVHAQLDTALEDGDEVAVLPPLAGG